MLVTQRQGQDCTLGLVVLGDLIVLCVESRSKQPPHGPRVPSRCSAHQFGARAALHNFAPEPLVLPRGAPSIPGRQPAWPSLSRQPPQRRDSGTVEQCPPSRGCRLRPPCGARSAPGRRREAQAPPGCLLCSWAENAGHQWLQNTSPSVTGIHFFQRSSTAGIYRTEGKFFKSQLIVDRSWKSFLQTFAAQTQFLNWN